MVVLTLLPLAFATAVTTIPLKESRDAIPVAFLDAQERLIQREPKAIKLEVEAPERQRAASMSVVEETAHWVIPPSLWDTLFHEFLEARKTVNHEPQVRTTNKSNVHYSWGKDQKCWWSIIIIKKCDSYPETKISRCVERIHDSIIRNIVIILIGNS